METIGLKENRRSIMWAFHTFDALQDVDCIRVDRNTLEDNITNDDPRAFTRTWTAQQVYHLKPDWEIMENVSEDSNQFLKEKDISYTEGKKRKREKTGRRIVLSGGLKSSNQLDVSGFTSPRPCRLLIANGPNSSRRVFSGCSSGLNFLIILAVSSARNWPASALLLNPTTISSVNRTKIMSSCGRFQRQASHGSNT
jgi:hypothetical protein